MVISVTFYERKWRGTTRKWGGNCQGRAGAPLGYVPGTAVACCAQQAPTAHEANSRGTLGRPAQTSSHCAHFWDLCVSIPADPSNPSVGSGRVALVLVVGPCAGVLLTAPIWILNCMVTWLKRVCLQTQGFQVTLGHPRDGQQDRAHFHT